MSRRKAREAAKAAATPVFPLVLGVLALGTALGVAGVLARHALGGISLPGCGAGSGCDQASQSVWGRVPGLEWPTAFVGVAWFAGALPAWLATGGRPGTALRWLFRLGGLGSLVLIGAMVAGGYLCQWCLAAHVANFVFIAAVELTRPSLRGPRAGLAPALGGFVLATGVLGALQWDASARAERVAEEQLAESTQDLVERARQSGAERGADAMAVATDDEVITPEAGEPAEPGLFRGRYVAGPDPAPIRVVIISDYQCPDCRRIEGELERLVDRRDDVAMTMMHFPFCTACNPQAPNLHPNACWAARAAEAAGMLRGAEGFWAMHRWLFANEGEFVDATLKQHLASQGYDVAEFLRVMESDATLELVKGDIAAAIDLGLYFTPMIFINGVELRGWAAQDALTRAVEALAAEGPVAAPVGSDELPTAVEKYLGDWREKRAMRFAPAAEFRAIGPADAAVQITAFVDFETTHSAELDQRIRPLLEGGDVRYELRYFPFSSQCNPAVSDDRYPGACGAARGVEAAGRLLGAAGFQAAARYLLEDGEPWQRRGPARLAEALGLDADELKAEMEAPEVAAAIAADVAAGRAVGIRGVPTLFVNGKQVPRWKLRDADIIGAIVAELRAGP